MEGSAFWREVFEAALVAEALRQAKLEIMKDYPNPFHWAAFCLQGDYR